MNDRQRDKLRSACDRVAKMLQLKSTPAEIIDALVRDHGATYSTMSDGYKLRCAGVAASCTWSRDAGLLNNWRKTATTRLMVDA